MTRVVLASVLVVALAGVSRGDDFSDVRTREQLLAQKWTREVNVALDTARRLERTDPASARGILQSALTGLQSAPGLEEKTRHDLSRQIELRLQGSDAVRPRPAAPSAFAQAPAAPLPVSPPSASTTRPSLTDTAKSFYERTKEKIDAGKAQKTEAGKAFRGTIAGAEQGGATPTGDQAMLLAPNHKELMAKREVPLNKKEAGVMKILGTPIAPDFTGMTLRQGFDYLNQKTGLLIMPDPQSLRDANVDLDEQVNFKSSSKLTVRSILRKMLADKGLSYIVNENGVEVVTVERARTSTVVRIYPIGDLVTPIQPQPQVVYDPFSGRFVPNIPGTGVPTQKAIAGAQIADLLRTTVDPSYWAPGGPGTIVFHEGTGSLAVRASAEIQFMISSALYGR
ncbi:MAG TPA: hypothetical protein VHR72_09945 [Gemmataceae bacterium]|jgi:hypothetical protein|nr:hypothetical protein [Gemmataceae bacterium]